MLGFEAISLSPLAWCVALQDDTEMLYLSKDDFNSLWKLQAQDPERQIILQKLEQNKYF